MVPARVRRAEAGSFLGYHCDHLYDKKSTERPLRQLCFKIVIFAVQPNVGPTPLAFGKAIAASMTVMLLHTTGAAYAGPKITWMGLRTHCSHEVVSKGERGVFT
jgi:hypothetical protein